MSGMWGYSCQQGTEIDILKEAEVVAKEAWEEYCAWYLFVSHTLTEEQFKHILDQWMKENDASL